MLMSMNLYIISDDPVECAEYLDDKRVAICTTDTAQILSDALHRSGVAYQAPYSAKAINHPCVVWCAESSANYAWVCAYLDALLTEFSKRFNRQHPSTDVWADLVAACQLVRFGGHTPFINFSMYKTDINVYSAYKRTLDFEWQKDKVAPTWYGKPAKEWIK